MAKPHTLAFLEPGHFHAALTLKSANPRVARNVHVYAPKGPGLDAFMALVHAFNTRADTPTDWHVDVHESASPLDALIDDQHADIVVLAGQNSSKLSTIAALHDAGVAVLADKPWLTDQVSLPQLDQVTRAMPLAIDMMTGRYEVLARLRRCVASTPAVFGEFDCSGDAIEIGSIHHVYKLVNGVPLVRPGWYYDVSVQGDGLVDIQSHVVDQMQWLVGEAAGPFDFDADVSDLEARRWGTPVPLDLFTDSTGLAGFPDELADWVTDGVLDYQCNSEIRYRLRGVPVCQRAQWRQREPEGGGDLHSARLRGTHAEIQLEHGPHTGYVAALHVNGVGGADIGPALTQALPAWQTEFPGLGAKPSAFGYELTFPDALRTPHEAHFAMVLNEFLDLYESGQWPAATAARIRARYTLLAEAKRYVDGQ